MRRKKRKVQVIGTLAYIHQNTRKSSLQLYLAHEKSALKYRCFSYYITKTLYIGIGRYRIKHTYGKNGLYVTFDCMRDRPT